MLVPGPPEGFTGGNNLAVKQTCRQLQTILITTPDKQTVKDAKQIFDFIANCDTKITREIELVLGELRSQCSMKPIQIKATEEQIKKGVPASYEVPVTFDTANFFG